MAKKGFIKDLNDVEILPITRGELVIDSSGKEAFHSNDFLATTSLPGLMSAEDKNKLDNLEGGIKYDIVSTTADGLAPKINTTASAITTQTDEWVLTTTKGATPSWRRLPVNAFLNRPISVNGTSILENNNTALNLVAGNNITLVPEKDTGKVTIHSNITDITGNAATADKLKNKVKLWGLEFDGSSDVSGSLTGVGDIYIDVTNNLDRYITFNNGYVGNIPFSWRLGYLGTGSGDANYFVIQSGKESDSTWYDALKLGLTTLNATFAGTVTAPTFNGKLAYTNLTGSTTTANQVIVSNGTANGWELKTLGSLAFDGYHESDFFREKRWATSSGVADANQLLFGAYHFSDSSIANTGTTNGQLIAFNGLSGNYQGGQLVFSHSNKLYSRIHWGGIYADWKQIAFTDSDITGNAATATKLKTAVKLWGNNFDGSSDVTGRIVATRGIYVSTSTGSLPLSISRMGNDKEITRIYQNDTGLVFDVTNDEKTSRVYWKFTATDVLNSDGTDAKSGILHFGINNSSKTYFAADEFLGNLNGKYINTLTGYAKATTAADLVETDTLNIALGKLEYKADIAYSWYRSITLDDTDEIINKWDEVVDFVNGLEVDLTEEFVTRKTDLVITGVKTFLNGSNNGKIKLENGDIISSLNVDGPWTRRLYFGNTSGNTSVMASFGVVGSGINSNNENKIHYVYIAHQDLNHNSASFKVYANRATILGNIILHTDNFNSYVPKLDGTGATGTWNINVNGSSTYLRSNSTKNLGLQDTLQICRGTHYGNEVDEWNTPYGHYTIDDNTPFDYGLVMRVRYGTTYYTDLWFDANSGAGTNTISYRQNVNGGLTDWIHILTNKNFDTYINGSYLKKSGDTMSGVLTSTVADGTAPFVVASKTLVNNLNTEYLNGANSSYYLRSYNRKEIGTAPNFDNPTKNRFFEVRQTSETPNEIGSKPYNGWYGMLSLRTSTTILQLAGRNAGGWYIRGNHGAQVTLENTSWQRLVVEDAHSREWDISVKGNAISTTKLQTARKLWGLSFDGTTDVNGTIHVKTTTGNYTEGIRLYGKTTDDSWSNILFGCSLSNTTATHANLWILGRNDINNFILDVNGADGKIMTWLKSGNVGIGTTTPKHKLHVNGDLGLVGDLTFRQGNISTPVYINSNSGSYYQRIRILDTPVNSSDVFTFQQSANSGETYVDLFSIKANGKVVSSGFVKQDSSDSYVLLGGGGHKAISDFLLKSELANLELSNNLTTITKELTVTQDWMDTGIKYTDLPASGTYIVQVYVKANDGTGGMYNCYWSGIMSWNIGGTSDDESDEILLHRSGYAYYNTIYLRTIMSSNSDSRHLRLLIAANRNIGAAYTYTFKFKRII